MELENPMLLRLPSSATLILAVSFGLLSSSPAGAVAKFVPGLVPDWVQPYNYPGAGGTGPGPRPILPPFTFDAWCAPTSAANLIGHWEDAKSVLIADGAAFPGEGSAIWPAADDWHDRKGDASRPAPGSGFLAAVTDVGWFMDTNNTGETRFGNGLHIGTYVKDIHAGLTNLLQRLRPGFRTGSQGRGFAIGLAPDGSPAASHPDAASAFAEIKSEIDAGRTMLISWTHWNVSAAGPPLPGSGGPGDESFHGGSYFNFGPFTPNDTHDNNEDWTAPPEDIKQTLGHVATAVGYIPAGSPDDPGYPAGGGGSPSDWVIVHDNVSSTARNVIVALNATTYPFWVQNTNAVFDPSPSVPALGAWGVGVLLALVAAAALLTLRRRSIVSA